MSANATGMSSRTASAFGYWLTRYQRTWRGSVLTSIVSPVLFLTAMGVGLGHYVHGGTGRVDGVRYAVFLAPGLLAATAMQTALGEASWPVLGAMKWSRSYLAMQASPLSVTEIMFGHLLFMCLRVGIVAASFTIVVALFGLAHSVPGAFLAMLAAILTGAAFAAPIAAFAASRERDATFALLYRFGVVPLFLFSGTFFPVRQLPAALQPLAYVTPLWHGVSLCRDLALGHGGVAAPVLHALYLLALLALGLYLGARVYRKRLQW
jgi:lipooligosaccharide transport system permease protein